MELLLTDDKYLCVHKQYLSLKTKHFLLKKKDFNAFPLSIGNIDIIEVFSRQYCIFFSCRSSNKDLWPIQCTILELPVDLRKKNIIMPALWFCNCKLNMQLLLQPFVEEVEHLATEGKIYLTYNKLESACALMWLVKCCVSLYYTCTLMTYLMM